MAGSLGVGNLLRDHRLAVGAFLRIPRQEDDARPVAAGRRQLHAEFRLRRPGEELVRQRGEHPGPIAGVLLVAQPATMHQSIKLVTAAPDGTT